EPEPRALQQDRRQRAIVEQQHKTAKTAKSKHVEPVDRVPVDAGRKRDRWKRVGADKNVEQECGGKQQMRQSGDGQDTARGDIGPHEDCAISRHTHPKRSVKRVAIIGALTNYMQGVRREMLKYGVCSSDSS